jgi:hypothetical protein
LRRTRKSIIVKGNIKKKKMNRRELSVEEAGDDMARVTGPCTFTGEEYSCLVPAAGLVRFLNGEHVQDALPEVSADDREFLISGISPNGWKKMFG